MKQQDSRGARLRPAIAAALLALLVVGTSAGCRRSPNAPTAQAQKEWERGPAATPPPQAMEAMRRAQQQQQQRR